MDDTTRLLTAAADGDRVALHGFIRATQADVWRFCAHLVDTDAADDLTQDTYIRAMRAAPNFRGESSARTWLLSIARRACADEIRRRQRRRPIERLTDEVPEVGVYDDTVDVELAGLLERLDVDRRAAFVATQLLGLSYAETAEALEVPVGTVRSRVARAREDLVVFLDAENPLTKRRHRRGESDV